MEIDGPAKPGRLSDLSVEELKFSEDTPHTEVSENPWGPGVYDTEPDSEKEKLKPAFEKSEAEEPSEGYKRGSDEDTMDD